MSVKIARLAILLELRRSPRWGKLEWCQFPLYFLCLHYSSMILTILWPDQILICVYIERLIMITHNGCFALLLSAVIWTRWRNNIVTFNTTYALLCDVFNVSYSIEMEIWTPSSKYNLHIFLDKGETKNFSLFTWGRGSQSAGRGTITNLHRKRLLFYG